MTDKTTVPAPPAWRTSANLPALIQVGDEEWDQSHFAELAAKKMGLTVDQWNGLIPEDRHQLIADVIDQAIDGSDDPLDRDGDGSPGGSLKRHAQP